jgi:acyl transferase domain-containing protein
MTGDDDSSLLKRALLKIEDLERRVREQERSINEPVAVVGIGCRFPGGVNTPETFWKLMIDGIDAISPFPAERLNVKEYQHSDSVSTAALYVNHGGFLNEDVSQFDAQFFGINKREADTLDPQQRLLLETSWEALENAGQNPELLAGSKTGVFVGIASNDYRQLVLQERNLSDMNLYYLTGNAFSTASGRLSYFMGLHGPSLTIDTACSASLTAVHCACQSIRMRECDIALAGGVNLILSPEDLLSYCNATMLSPEGHCKSFDKSADGFVLSEGCGIVVLKRLSDAVNNNDTIYAVIRGSSVNQDGASNGLTAPNSLAQEMLIREALERGHLSASDISYIEAHGSGTPLGDPIEVQSLASVFGMREGKDPLTIGCVKTNIGHLAAAAGIAGLIKAALSVYHGKIPRNLHFSNPNPLIPWDSISARVPTENMDWIPSCGIRRAGVSSFGISGTNAHIILEESPKYDLTATNREWQMLPLSAKSETALNSMAANLNAWLQQNMEISLADIAYTLQTGRKSFPFRHFIVCRNTTEAKTEFASGNLTSVNRHIFSGRTPKVILVFPGQGSQYPGMGATLYKSESIFRKAFDRCIDAFQKHLGEDIRNIVFTYGSSDDVEKLRKTYYAQPAIFALEYSLACLWLSWGIQPVGLVGHSIGEFVAACIAGVMNLDDATKLIAKRSCLMQSLPAGAMISVRSSEDAVTSMLSPGLSIAAVNSPFLCVVSGPFDEIAAFQSRCDTAGIQIRPLHTSHAFHSMMVEPILPTFNDEVNTISLSKPNIPIMSTVNGTWLSDADALDPMYWTRHMRVTVRFSSAISKLITDIPFGLFLEVGPRSTNTMLIRQHINDTSCHTAVASLSDSGEPNFDMQYLMKVIGELWMHGIYINWQAFYSTEKRKKILLPSYPFERQRYWINKNSPQVRIYNDRSPELNESRSDHLKKLNVGPLTESIVVPENEHSSKIRNLIATALGCTPGSIGEAVQFLHLGMDSLLMRQFSQQIKVEFNVSVSVRQLMREYSTIQTLTTFINSTGTKGL